VRALELPFQDGLWVVQLAAALNRTIDVREIRTLSYSTDQPALSLCPRLFEAQ